MSSEGAQWLAQRRIAPLPVVLAAAVVIAILVATTVVVTLAVGTGPSTEVPTGPIPVVTPSVLPEPQPTGTKETAPVAPAGESTGSRCLDYTHEVDSLDLVGVEIGYTSRDELSVRFELLNDIPEGTFRLGLVAARDDGERLYQFAVDLDDREVVEASAQEFVREKQDRINTKHVSIDESAVTLVIPRSVSKHLEEEWSWSAFSSYGGDVIDSCPGSPGGSDFLTFSESDD